MNRTKQLTANRPAPTAPATDPEAVKTGRDIERMRDSAANAAPKA